MVPPRRSKRDPRKVQTRLSFEPKPTSPSHASSGISPARIVYQDPRNPKKKQPSSSANTKEPSSSARSIPYFSDDEDIFADGKKFAVVLPSPSRTAARGQARGKSFMGAASSSVKQRGRPRKSAAAYETDSESEEEIRAPAEKTKKTPFLLEDSNESEEEDIIAPAGKVKKPAAVLRDSSESSSEDEDEDEVATPADKRRKRPAFLKSRSESPLKSPPRAIVKNGVVETPQKPREDSPSPKKPKSTPIRSFIAGGYLNPAPIPRSAKNQRDPAKNDKPVSSKSKGKEIVAISSDEDSDSDGIVVEQPSIRKQKADSDRKEKALPSRKRGRSASSEEDDEPIRSSPTKRRKQVISEETSDEESDEESEPVPTVPARHLTATPRKGQKPTKTKSSETKKGKEESTRQTRQMNTPKKHRTEKQKKLELLKRRRAGEKIDELTESSSDYQEEKGAYDSDASHAALSVFDDEDSEEANIEQVRQSLRPSNRNLDDDSFIVSDDDAPLGAPIHHEIPLEFTHHAHKHLKEHFKDAIEWMVQKKINPGFNHRDPIYIQAFRKLEPEARGLAQSKFSSAAWTEGFTRALWSRPQFHEEDISAGGEGEGRKCDACGRSNHPAKFRIQLLGKPYYQDTLENVEDSDDEDDDGDDDAASVNSKGQKVLPADTEFYLGRFCRANAERAHALIHWKHALYEWVVQTLSDQGFLDAEKLAERVKWGQRKLGALANEIVDEWTEKGEIKGLYRDFRNNLEAARNNKQDRWNA
ncbi:hypothetical protein V502_01426 [Pseudogymnoascus sp. VKM F-4520 (FW-2644)]|nr:hypothetical protein V502_01426 [Pseudogymnoascus sp. VKM F-4520 (FW-2644)]